MFDPPLLPDDDDDQYNRTDILKLILYDLNSAIAPRESRLLAIRTALEEFDHDDELLHEEELDLRADHILLQKLTYALSIDPCSDEVGYICSAFEAVYRASKERLAESFHEVSDALLPLFVDLIRPTTTTRGGWGVEFSLRRRHHQQKQMQEEEEALEKDEHCAMESVPRSDHQANSTEGDDNTDDKETVESVKCSSTEAMPDTMNQSNHMKPTARQNSQEGNSVHPTTVVSASAEAQELPEGAIVPARFFGNQDRNDDQQTIDVQHQIIVNMNPISTTHTAILPPLQKNDTIRMELEDAKQVMMLNHTSESLSSALTRKKYGDDTTAMTLRGGGGGQVDDSVMSEKDDERFIDREGDDDNFFNDKSELTNDDDSSVLQSELNDLFCESRRSVASRLMYDDQDNPFSDTSSLYDASTVASSFRNYDGGDTSVNSESKTRDLSGTNFHDATSYLKTDGGDSSIGVGGDDWRGVARRGFNDYDIPQFNEHIDDGAENSKVHYNELSDNNHGKIINQWSSTGSVRPPQCDEHDRHGDALNGTKGDDLSQSQMRYLNDSSTSRCYSGSEFHDSSAQKYEQGYHPNNEYHTSELSNPFGGLEYNRDHLRQAQETDSAPSEYPRFEEHRQPTQAAQYTSEPQLPIDGHQFDEEKFPLKDESSNLSYNDGIRCDEDILQFQKLNLSLTSHHHYHNYFDPMAIDVCPVAIRKVLKILRYFSRVLSAMEPMAQQFNLVDTLLYHMMKKPLPDDHDNETASRIDAIAVVVNLACAEENKQMLVHHPGLLDVVINIANHDPIDEAREHASIVLMNLAYAEENKVHMVHQDYLLDSLITLLSDVSPYTRRYASATLFTLACTYANTAIMAKHCNGGILEALRKVLLSDPIDEARVNAAEAIFNMSRNNTDDIADIMGNHPRLLASLSHSVLTDYSADVRAYSARALEWLSADIHHPMPCHQILLKALVTSSQWTKTTCIAEALKAQASLLENRMAMVEHPGLLNVLGTLALLEGVTYEEVRICAIAAIERLSNEVSARRIMVKNEAVMTALTKATFASNFSPDDALVDGVPIALLTKAALKNLSACL